MSREDKYSGDGYGYGFGDGYGLENGDGYGFGFGEGKASSHGDGWGDGRGGASIAGLACGDWGKWLCYGWGDGDLETSGDDDNG